MLTLQNKETLAAERLRKLQLAAETLAPFIETLLPAEKVESFTCCAEPCPAPALTFIVPVYNVEEYLFRCLDSLVCQTLREIEIICVDDCSTDRSREILDFFALLDARVTVIRHEKNSYAGVARNTGIAAARGEYLFFADPDDWCERTLAEKAVKNGRKYGADVVTIPVRRVDAENGETIDLPNAIASALNQTMPFSRKELPDRILNVVTPAPWNKIFRRTFIEKEGLLFQEIRTNNDVFFSVLALALAVKISCISSPYLYNHRIGVAKGLQATKAKSPLCAFQAYRKVKEELEKRELLPELADSFRKLVIQNVIIYNLLKKPARGEGFLLFYQELHDRFIAETGLDKPAPNDSEEATLIIKRVLKYKDPIDFLQESLLFYREYRPEYSGWKKRLLSFCQCLDENGWRYTVRHLFYKTFHGF